jgi:hypothetical protein
MKSKKLYICIGENYREDIGLGYCGDVHTLPQWLEILFPSANAAEYFKDDPEKEILDYILKNRGKRLEPFK